MQRSGRRRGTRPVGPSRIAGEPADDVHVQLRHDIAQRGDIGLVGPHDFLQQPARRQHLGVELQIVGLNQIGQLDDARPPRQQQQPVEARVILEPENGCVSGQSATATLLSSIRGSSSNGSVIASSPRASPGPTSLRRQRNPRLALSLGGPAHNGRASASAPVAICCGSGLDRPEE